MNLQPTAHPPRSVIDAYPVLSAARDIECLGGAGGFSGASLWRFSTLGQRYCLRRWPAEHPAPARLAWIHSVLRFAASHGFARLPVPLETVAGNTWFPCDGVLWELAPWLPGTADYWSAPSTRRLQSAMTALAQFHVAVEAFAPRPRGPSPGIGRRVQQLERLWQGGFAATAAAVSKRPKIEIPLAARRMIEVFPRLSDSIGSSLREAANLEVPIQPCLRDIWHDHLLFEAEEVAGIVDFGAMLPETVAGDVARLLGSLVGDDEQGWQAGLAAYESRRPLAGEERQLLRTFDRSGLLLGGMNWLEWIYCQGRQFGDLEAVSRRLEGIVARLERCATGNDLRDLG